MSKRYLDKRLVVLGELVISNKSFVLLLISLHALRA